VKKNAKKKSKPKDKNLIFFFLESPPPPPLLPQGSHIQNIKNGIVITVNKKSKEKEYA